MRSGAMQEEIRGALLDAFRQAYQMEIVVSNADIGTTFANYLAVPGTTYEQAMFNLLIWVESQDKLVPFLKAAQKSNPGNPKLKVVMAKFAGLEARFGALRPDVELGETERIVLKGVKFEDVGVWIDTLARARAARAGPPGRLPGRAATPEPEPVDRGVRHRLPRRPGRGDDQLPRREAVLGG